MGVFRSLGALARAFGPVLSSIGKLKFQDTEKAENHTKTSLSTCNKDIICDDFLKLFDTGKHAPSKVFT